MFRSRLVHAFVVIALLAAPPFLFTHRALAIEDPDFRVLFGPVGITLGEIALVNVYAVGNPNEIGNPNDTPWTFVVRVFDPRGTLVQEQKLQLAAGVIGSVAVAIQDEENRPHASEPSHISCGVVGFNPRPTRRANGRRAREGRSTHGANQARDRKPRRLARGKPRAAGSRSIGGSV